MPNYQEPGFLGATVGPTALVQWRTGNGLDLAFRVTVSTSLLEGTVWQVEQTLPVQLGVDCTALARSPGGRESPNHYIPDVNASAARGRLQKFVFSVGLSARFGDRPASQGWDLYEYYQSPRNGDPQAYQYAVEPSTRMLEFLRYDPELMP